MTNTADVTIVIKEKKQNREISCHMVILCARSEYFRAMYKVRPHRIRCSILYTGNYEVIIDSHLRFKFVLY
jgi:hypothetical protein